MKIAILSRDGSLYSCKRLLEAARARGHSIDVIDPLSCYMNINPGASAIHYRVASCHIMTRLFHALVRPPRFTARRYCASLKCVAATR
ncbi:hypothetical protein ERHA55_15690 [Erwinia rhapontici]|nr:hypothetical protein ERHA55_15690 [Erwinia rhapontici]